MKNLLITVFIILSFLGCGKDPEQFAAVDIKFDGFTNSDKAYMSIIETERNDTTVHLDTVIHEFLLSKTNGYTFQLEFKTESLNGNFLIYADSIKGVNIITDLNVNKDFTFTYFFNGIPKTEKDHYLIITRNNQ